MADETTKDTEVPEEEALEALFRSRYREGSAWAEDAHEDARKDFRYYGGHQWSEEDKEWGKARRYPCLTLNQIFSTVNAPSSSEIVNRFEPKFLPRSEEDQDLADKTTQIGRYIRQQAGAEFVDSGTFRDSLICGMGAADWYFDETIGRDGKIQTTRIPIEEVIWDPAARKQNLEDARWLIRGLWIDVDEFKALFPDAELPEAVTSTEGGPSSGNMFMWGRSTKHVTGLENYSPPDAKSSGFYFPEQRTVLVFEMQDYVLVPEWVVPTADGVMRLSDTGYKNLRAIRKKAGEPIPAGQKRMRREYRRSIFAGTDLVKKETLPTQRFTILILTCFEDQTEDGMRWFGLVKPLRDPQNIANRGISQVIHSLATGPKGTVLHDGTVFENAEEAETQWSTANAFVETTPGALNPAEPKLKIIEAKYPVEFERITEFALNAVPQISGINPHFMGSTGGDLRRVSGTALSQVIQQGQMMLSIPFDGLRKFRMDQGHILLSFMRTFLPPEATMRIVGDITQPGPQFAKFMRDELDNVMFDVVVGEVPVSPTAQREAWTALTESGALKSLVDHGWLGGKEISVLAADWPEEVRQMVRQRASQQETAVQAAPPQGGQRPPAGPQPPVQ